jgi:dihydrofolate reductase
MRDVILYMSMSLDGFVASDREHPGMATPEGAELKQWKLDRISKAGAHLMGRVTYQEMSSYWPQSDDPYAPPMNDIPKVVFSKTLVHVEWEGTRIASGALAEDIDRLKREPGGVILAHGGQTFIDSLVRENLIDEYRLVLHPVVIGHGTSLFRALERPLRLDLVEARTFPSGTAIHTYRPSEETR